MYIVRLESNEPLALALAPGASIEDVAAGRDWIDVESIPNSPPETWAVDWVAGTVATDPDKLPPTPPDWEGLVLAVMGNAEFKAAWVAAAAIDPTVAWSLPTAFGMVGQGHPGNFINLFNEICALAQVSPEQRAAWADIGATFNAPAEFLDIVRGV